jgi:hypothetical protein
MRVSTSGRSGARIDERAVREWAAAYDAGLVTWVVGADTTVVVHVSRSGEARGAVVQLGRRVLEGGVRRLREVAIANDARTLQEYAAEIQAALFPDEIADALARGSGRMLVCAHGPLERLPFELLPLFRAGDASAFVPVVLPGLVEASPGAAPASHAGLEWSIAGDPVDARGAARLPGVRAEIAELKALHPNAVARCGSAFDRAALLELLASGRALHVATHLTSDRSKTSSIDTRLAHAAFEMSRGAPVGVRDILDERPRLPLAVLSACDSAGGDFIDGEAALGVAKAFLESGTRNLLVTSWPVEDEAARRFAVAFHRALQAGERPSVAAVTAREALRAAGAPVADWAAFRLLGRD